MSKSELNIGHNVGLKLFEKRIKQADLAAAVCCSPGMVTKIITGDKIPSVKILVDISEYLGCTVDDLLKG